ncbi:3632_t:CDS:2 [Cetraspora pellucida]|uniref:3632_t:CDS:1 n=1 Tax=Cetraspora pellucida TaxID=1433469 RepID=A0A9N8WJK2_9GLOM|nr:3632_t:CDS:2 [Cetraspora pellucida]
MYITVNHIWFMIEVVTFPPVFHKQNSDFPCLTVKSAAKTKTNRHNSK